MSSPLRIVHAVSSNAFAGVEQFVLRLATRQARDGHDVHVIGGATDRMEDALNAHRVSFTPAGSTIATYRAIRAARDAHVLNAHMTAADVAASFALRGGGPRPALVSTRHFVGVRGRGTRIPLDRLIAGRIDAEIAISRAVAASIGLPSTVVYSGVETEDAPGVPRAHTVLMAQRLEAEKGTDVGIRAFAVSGLQSRGWTLEIAGDGAQRGSLEHLARQYGVSARFMGFRDDVPQLMRRAGIFLAPCAVEGLGLAVIEALSNSTPVVAADAGGHHEILEDLDPRALYAPADPEAAGRALRALADDEAGRSALGIAGRARQRARFTLAEQAAQTEDVYRRAIAARIAEAE